MTKNYQSLQATYFPNNATVCNGDPTIYADLIWVDGVISQAALDAEWLNYLKGTRYVEIDTKTGQLIAEGFTWDSKVFSLSINAQINWSNLPNLPDSIFPLSISTINDEEVYTLSLANKMNFYYTAVNGKNGPLQSGNTLKAQITACADEACVNSIVDNRMP
jgi:hypothetical protein